MSQSIKSRVYDWTFNVALPLWSSNGLDRQFGGYYEQLKFDGTSVDVPFKRVRVICRQIYVFSHAYILGWEPGLEYARYGYEFLIRNGWLGESGGWALEPLRRDRLALDRFTNRRHRIARLRRVGAARLRHIGTPAAALPAERRRGGAHQVDRR